MKLALQLLFGKLRQVIAREEGQDLVEYALIVALISLAAVVGMHTLASDINGAFTKVGTTINSSI